MRYAWTSCTPHGTAAAGASSLIAHRRQRPALRPPPLHPGRRYPFLASAAGRPLDRNLVGKVPKPPIRTSLPLAKASVFASNTASTASPAADLPPPAGSASRPTISDLFTRSLPALPRSPTPLIHSTDLTRGRPPQLAQSAGHFDPADSVTAPFLPKRCRRSSALPSFTVRFLAFEIGLPKVRLEPVNRTCSSARGCSATVNPGQEADDLRSGQRSPSRTI